MEKGERWSNTAYPDEEQVKIIIQQHFFVFVATSALSSDLPNIPEALNTP